MTNDSFVQLSLLASCDVENWRCRVSGSVNPIKLHFQIFFLKTIIFKECKGFGKIKKILKKHKNTYIDIYKQIIFNYMHDHLTII